MLAARARHLHPACCPLVALGASRDATHTPDPLTLSGPLLLLCSPFLSSPNAPESAARRSHDHRAPLASLKRQEAPPRSPLPPSPRRKAPEALDAASSAVPFLGPPRSSPPFRHLQASSKHADHPNVSAVSSRIEFPSSPPRFLAVAVAPLKTEPRHRTSSSSATFR